eukprot:3350123-Ditylum_brightwellii.AAC.1
MQNLLPSKQKADSTQHDLPVVYTEEGIISEEQQEISEYDVLMEIDPPVSIDWKQTFGNCTDEVLAKMLENTMLFFPHCVESECREYPKCIIRSTYTHFTTNGFVGKPAQIHFSHPLRACMATPACNFSLSYLLITSGLNYPGGTCKYQVFARISVGRWAPQMSY